MQCTSSERWSSHALMDSQHRDTSGERDNAKNCKLEKQLSSSSSEENDRTVLKNNVPKLRKQCSCSSSSSRTSDISSEDTDKPKLKKKLSYSHSYSSSSSSSSDKSSEGNVPKLKKQSSYSPSPPSDEASDNNAAKFDKQSSFSSSSSEAYSEESFFQLDASELSNPMAGLADTRHGKHIEFAGAKAEVWSAWPGQAQDGQTFFSYVPSTNPGPDSSTMFRPTRAPPIQTMAQPDGLDPSRIPLSIFRTKSTTPAEWSVTSNESLFSIQVARSGDLAAFYNGQFDHLHDTALQGSTTPVSLEPEWKLPALEETADAHIVDAVVAASADGHASDGSGSAKGKKSVTFRNDSASDGSSTSNYSFAFPILTDASPKNNSLYQPLRKGCQQRQSATLTEDPEAAPSTAKRRWTFGYSWFACSWRSCCRCRRCF